MGRWEEADSVQDSSDNKGGFNSFRIMKWLSIGVVGPFAVLTLLAVPIHLSITDFEVRVGHYASFRPDIFPLKDARSLTIVDVHGLKGDRSHQTKDVVVGFADGRTPGNQVGDDGTSVRNDISNSSSIRLVSRPGIHRRPSEVSIVWPGEHLDAELLERHYQKLKPELA